MNPSESSYRGPGKGPRTLFQAFSNLSGPPPSRRDSVGPLQHQHLFQIVAYPLQPKVIEVAPPAEIATSRQPIAALPGADDPLHSPAHSRKEFVPFLLLHRNGTITPGPIDDAAEHPPASP